GYCAKYPIWHNRLIVPSPFSGTPVDSTGKKAQLTGKKAQLTGKKAQLTGYNHRPRAVAAPYKQERTRKNAKSRASATRKVQI
ncbi:hypothetical protein, partial [Pseudomonas helleri]|uniref:hypothetical protein n=1 Tax=Pseudomonas helleri TaxID=1608996 RepID=UPI001E31F8C8